MSRFNLILLGILLAAFACLAIADKYANIDTSTLAPRRCSNNCNAPNGQCINDYCVCSDNWAGDDCSINVITLTSGNAHTADVSMWSWHYYRINVAANQNFVLELTQSNNTDRPGDCDIYANRGTYPSHTQYLWRDISLDSYVRHEFTQPAGGTYFFGVFGFLRTQYSIRVTLVGSCPNGCSGHGNCVNGQCACHNGYAGEACQFTDVELRPNTPVEAVVNKGEMNYFHARLSKSEPSLTWTVVQLSSWARDDVDLYIKYNGLPNITNWDYANGTLSTTTTLTVPDAKAGTWYAGIYGFNCPSSGCRFRISYTINSDTCADRCSLHGICSNPTCICQNGYTGTYCETKTSHLQFDETIPGFVKDNAWNWYTMRPNSLNPVFINILQVDGGDCDLFVRENERPTRFVFDYQDVDVKQNFTLEIGRPGSSVWHIGLYGFSKCEYRITISTRRGDSSDCQNGGYRPTPTSPCVCPSGFGGDQCQFTVTNLAPYPSHVAQGRVTQNTWIYYNFTTTTRPAAIYFHLAEIDPNAGGEIWLFVREQVVPSLREYDNADLDTNSAFHRVTIKPTDARPTGSYIVGVYGNPFLIRSRANYNLVAWSTPF